REQLGGGLSHAHRCAGDDGNLVLQDRIRHDSSFGPTAARARSGPRDRPSTGCPTRTVCTPAVRCTDESSATPSSLPLLASWSASPNTASWVRLQPKSTAGWPNLVRW